MMTIQELRRLVGISIGLQTTFSGTVDAYRALSRERQVELTRGMLEYILAHPEQFTSGQVETARVEAPRAQTMGIDDESYSWTLFVDSALETAQGVTWAGGSTLSTAVILGVVAFAIIAAGRLFPSKKIA